MPVLRVLIVDDLQERAYEYARLLLRKEGDHVIGGVQTEVAIAVNAEEAIRRLIGARAEHRPFDVMVTGLFMPGEDGLALIRRLREEEFDRDDLDVVLLSQGSREETSSRRDEIDATAAEWGHG